MSIAGEDAGGSAHVPGWLVPLLALLAVLSVGVAVGAAVYLIAFGADHQRWVSVLFSNIAPIIGVPLSAALSFSIVVFLRQAVGPIEFTGVGFSFKGASGQVAMWVICFLALVSAIKMLWSS